MTDKQIIRFRHPKLEPNLSCDGTADAEHTTGDGCWWEKDDRGHLACLVCARCRDAKVARYVRGEW